MLQLATSQRLHMCETSYALSLFIRNLSSKPYRALRTCAYTRFLVSIISSRHWVMQILPGNWISPPIAACCLYPSSAGWACRFALRRVSIAGISRLSLSLGIPCHLISGFCVQRTTRLFCRALHRRSCFVPSWFEEISLSAVSLE